MTSHSRVWNDTLCRVRNEIPDFAFDAWIAPLAVKIAPRRIALGCPSSFHRDRIRMLYRDTIETCLQQAIGSEASEAPWAVELITLGELAQRPGRLLESSNAEAPRRAALAGGAAAVPAGSPGPSPAAGRSAEPADRVRAPRAVPERDLEIVPSPAPRARSPRADALPGRRKDTTRPKTPAEASRKPAIQEELPFSFESFVVGPCNALAREAALALARARQQSLDLLYLGGGAGLGKTHLARATAAEAQRQRLLRGDGAGSATPRRDSPGVVYTSAEQFTTEFVSAMRNGRSEEFKRRYRGRIGLLIVEDIQFFSGRAKTQLELFHTVQHVLDAGGRVLLTGDRAPRSLSGLDERMRAQVGRGFVAELEPPDAVVRRHILRAKAAGGGVHLPDDCLDLLVESTRGSVRDIEGMLIQVVTTASLLGRPIDLALTREAIALKTSTGPALARRRVAVEEIVRIVAAFFGKRAEALAARSRRRDVLVPRQLAMYLAHRYTDASLGEIGRSLGRGHPSVRNAIERVERQVLESAPLRYQVEALSERIDRMLTERSEGDGSEPTRASVSPDPEPG